MSLDGIHCGSFSVSDNIGHQVRSGIDSNPTADLKLGKTFAKEDGHLGYVHPSGTVYTLTPPGDGGNEHLSDILVQDDDFNHNLSDSELFVTAEEGTWYKFIADLIITPANGVGGGENPRSGFVFNLNHSGGADQPASMDHMSYAVTRLHQLGNSGESVEAIEVTSKSTVIELDITSGKHRIRIQGYLKVNEGGVVGFQCSALLGDEFADQEATMHVGSLMDLLPMPADEIPVE